MQQNSMSKDTLKPSVLSELGWTRSRIWGSPILTSPWNSLPNPRNLPVQTEMNILAQSFNFSGFAHSNSYKYVPNGNSQLAVSIDIQVRGKVWTNLPRDLEITQTQVSTPLKVTNGKRRKIYFWLFFFFRNIHILSSSYCIVRGFSCYQNRIIHILVQHK